jgi:hypothetical protein
MRPAVIDMNELGGTGCAGRCGTIRQIYGGHREEQQEREGARRAPEGSPARAPVTETLA